jgi:hypothetical protein
MEGKFRQGILKVAEVCIDIKMINPDEFTRPKRFSTSSIIEN